MENIPPINTVLVPVTREDSEDFDTNADKLMTDLPVWTGEINAVTTAQNILSGEINAISTVIEGNAAAAAESEAVATQAAANAASAANAIPWLPDGISRPFAALETLIYTDGLSYRCMIATTAGESPDTNPEKWKSLVLSGIKDDPNPELGGDLALKGFDVPVSQTQLEALHATALYF